MNKFPPSLAELPPISSPTRVVTIERMEDFTRLSLIIPNDAVASVRVGTQVRINGSPLLVASVNRSQNDPNSVVASFGIAQSSPLANTLKQLYPDATVQFEVDGMPVGHADVMDQLARKNARESQRTRGGNLPGTREWYSNTLPWYSKMYPDAQVAEGHTSTQGSRYMEQNGGGSTTSHGHGHDAAPSDSYFPPSSSGNHSPTFSPDHSTEERLMSEWSRQAEDARRDRAAQDTTQSDAGPASWTSDDDDYGAVMPDQIDSTSGSTGLAPAGGSGGWGISPNQFMGALEKMAERNSMLSDRVERLLEAMEARGASTSEIATKRTELEAQIGEVLEEVSAEVASTEAEPILEEVQTIATAPVFTPAQETPVETKAPETKTETDKTLDKFTVETSVTKHPGIVAEIKSRVGVDETTRDVTIELTGTIHRDMNSTHTPPKGAFEMRDYVALGTQALSDAARKLAEQSNKEASFAEHGDETAETQHGDIQRILQNGKVIWVEAMGEVMGKYGHPCYRLRLQDDKDAESDTPRVIDCVFKPALEGHGDGWHRAPMEYVAYKLSRMLGMDLVPPAAYRNPEEGIQVDYKTFNEGAFLYWVDGADDLCKTGDYDTAVRTGCWGEGVDPRVILSDTRVLDVLLQNSDRHEGHFLFGRHWTEGGLPKGGGLTDKGQLFLSGSQYRPTLIDHAAAFRKEAFVAMDHENAFQTGPTTVVRAKTYLRLRFLDHAAIKREFGWFLSGEEQLQLLERRDTILEYLDRLVAERGYDEVVIH